MSWTGKTKDRVIERFLYSDLETRVCVIAIYKEFDPPMSKDEEGWRGDWAVYIGSAPVHLNREACIARVRERGSKLHETVARALFGAIAEKMDELKQSYRG